MQVLIHNKNEAYKHIQAELGRALLRLFDSKTDRDDALISNYANARKNPSKDIVKKALHLQPAGYSKLVRHFEKVIIPFLNPNELPRIVRLLSIVVWEDNAIYYDTPVNLISGLTKAELRGTTDNNAEFLSGLFLYVLRHTDNREGLDEEGFVNRIMSEAEELFDNYTFDCHEVPGTIESDENTKKCGMTSTSNEIPSEEDILEARSFCMKYEDTIGLLPLCQVAFCVNPAHNNVRRMYSDFCLCKQSVRNEILRMNGLPKMSEDKQWIRESIEKYKKEIREIGLADRECFYDDAKYFHRAFEWYSEESVDLEKDSYIFERLVALDSQFFGFNSIPKDKCKLSDYIQDYMWEKEHHPEREMVPPLDYLWDNLGLCQCRDESKVTEWICRFIIASSFWLKEEQDIVDDRWGGCYIEDYMIETQEDLYYYALLRLYEVYMG